MKGVYSSADQRHYRAVKRHLFRGHPIYSIDSGGDPRAIPSLTYEAFEAFHRTYYHPANARLFVYGRTAELPLAERLQMLQGYLGDFGPLEGGAEDIPLQPLATAPYEASEEYPLDPSRCATHRRPTDRHGRPADVHRPTMAMACRCPPLPAAARRCPSPQRATACG